MSRQTILFFVLSFLFLWNSEGRAGEWKAFQTTRSGDIYYFDPESIERTEEAALRVWMKTERTEFGGGDFRKNVDEVVSGKKDKVTGEILQLVDIDCSRKTFRVVNLAVFDKNKDIKEYYSDPSEWNAIPSGSVINALREEVCK